MSDLAEFLLRFLIQLFPSRFRRLAVGMDTAAPHEKEEQAKND
jgi:hypothetical protein